MPKEEWGTKRVCPTTGKRFYDLGKNPDQFAAWVNALKGHVVGGSPRWEIYRVA